MRPSRRRRILGLVDLSDSPGLEVGPLYAPIALKSAHDVRYVDVRTTQGLRDYYADDPKVDVDQIADVDFALIDDEGVTRRLSEVAAPDAPYAWIIASHVIEHIPDVIEWLSELADLCRDDGHLVLAVPDFRFTFDHLRPQTTVGQMLHAHDLLDTAPNVRAVFDSTREAVKISSAEAWAGLVLTSSDRPVPVETAIAQVDLAVAGQYVDSHVWTWRPRSFVEQIDELGRLGLCEFVVDTIDVTRRDALEFHVALRRLPRVRTAEQDLAWRDQAVTEVDDSPRPPRRRPPAGAMTLSHAEARMIERKRRLLRGVRRLLPTRHSR